MTRLRSTAATAALCLLLVPLSCFFNPVDLGGTDDLSNEFELVWQTFDRHYPCFHLTDVDWDEMHETYGAMADEAVSQEELVEIMVQMCAEMEDPGIVFTTPEGTLYTCPQEIEPNYDIEVLLTYLEPHGFTWMQGDSWGWCIIDDALYVMIQRWGTIEIEDLIELYEDHPDISALIIDTRMNSGMGMDRLGLVVCTFNDIVRIGYFSVTRDGPGHGDLGRMRPRYVPQREDAFTGPVAVLIGEQCGSISVKFACMVSEISSVTTMGDTTMRFSNVLQDFSLPAECSYSLPESTMIRADSVTWVHATGVPPDIYVEATPEDFLAGIDPVLDYAMDWAEDRSTRR